MACTFFTLLLLSIIKEEGSFIDLWKECQENEIHSHTSSESLKLDESHTTNEPYNLTRLDTLKDTESHTSKAQERYAHFKAHESHTSLKANESHISSKAHESQSLKANEAHTSTLKAYESHTTLKAHESHTTLKAQASHTTMNSLKTQASHTTLNSLKAHESHTTLKAHESHTTTHDTNQDDQRQVEMKSEIMARPGENNEDKEKLHMKQQDAKQENDDRNKPNDDDPKKPLKMFLKRNKIEQKPEEVSFDVNFQKRIQAYFEHIQKELGKKGLDVLREKIRAAKNAEIRNKQEEYFKNGENEVINTVSIEFQAKFDKYMKHLQDQGSTNGLEILKEKIMAARKLDKEFEEIDADIKKREKQAERLLRKGNRGK
ncbi:hypothetical protein WDU94_002924 [Cyamophila willieti]